MKAFVTVLKVAISVLLVAWLIRTVAWREVLVILSHASVPGILLYLLLQVAGNLLSAAKWQYLAALHGFSFSLREGFFAYLTGAFINNFLPSTVGGDTYRTLWLGKRGERLDALSVVLFDRLSGLLGLIVLSAFGFLFLPLESYVQAPWLPLLAAVLLGFLVWSVLLFLLTARFFALALFLAALFPWPRLLAFIKRFTPYALPHTYAMSMLFSFAFMLVGVGLTNWFLFQSLGVELAPGQFFGAIFLATLVANIPISINNIGVKEWSYALFFGFFGVSLEVAVTAALLSRFLQMLLSCLALPYYWRTGDGTASGTTTSSSV